MKTKLRCRSGNGASRRSEQTERLQYAEVRSQNLARLGGVSWIEYVGLGRFGRQSPAKEVRGTSESIWDFSPSSSRESTVNGDWSSQLEAKEMARLLSRVIIKRRERSRYCCTCQRKGGLVICLCTGSAVVPSAVPNLFGELKSKQVESCSRVL